MSCSVCAGHSSQNCPCCGGNTRMVECDEYNGVGIVYYAFDIHKRVMARCTELAFLMLPYDEDDARENNARWCQGCAERCDTCKGDGQIPEW